MRAKDYIKEVLEIEIPETDIISGEWFTKNNLPMVVACTCCQMTMSLFSADIKKDGAVFCSSCAPDEEEYNNALDDCEDENDGIRIVRCNDCYWIGHEDNLVIIDDVEHCPKCKRSDCLMDVFEEYMNDEDIELELSVDDDDWEDVDPDELADMHSCDISGICSTSCDLYYECNMQCKG